MSHSRQALEIASASRFPIAYNGDGWLFYAALFSLTVIMLLLAEMAIHIGKQMWLDRHQPKTIVLTLRATFMLVCITGLFRVVPEVAYRVAWNEASVSTIQVILIVKESFNLLAGGTLLCWVLLHRYFEPLWTLRLNNMAGQVWGGNRKFLNQALLMSILSALLAGSVTFYKAFG